MSAIERYLDDLFLASRGLPAHEARALVAETEAHLYDALEDGRARGLTEDGAAVAAVAAFGPIDDLVRRERERTRLSLVGLAGQVARSGIVLGAVGAVAVGLSGLVAMVAYWIGGASAIAPRPSGADLTASNCARWVSLHAGSCRAAALSDWAYETMSYRIAAGVLGVAVLVGYRFVARRRRSGLSPVVTETIATTLFTVAAIVTTALGIDALITSSGAGQWLTAAPVAIGATAIFATRLTKRLREPGLA